MTDDTPTPEQAALERLLGRYPHLPCHHDPFVVNAASRRAVSAIATGDNRIEWRDIAIRHEDPATSDDVADALELCRAHRTRLDEDELELIEMAVRRGMAWAQIARRLGLRDGAAAKRRLGQLREAHPNHRRWARDVTADERTL